MKILVRFVHKVTPSDRDVEGPFSGTATDLADLPRTRAFLKRHLGLRVGRALGYSRDCGFVVFPGHVDGSQIWHAVILEPLSWVPREHEHDGGRSAPEVTS